jgi:hypothetical protein
VLGSRLRPEAQGPPPVWAKAVTYTTGGYGEPTYATTGDLNGDGHLDLVVANPSSNSVSVLLGNGNGTFQPAGIYSSGGYYPNSVAIADVNGDGKPDMVVANYCQANNCSGDGEVSVLLGNGDGTFQTAVSYDSGGYRASSVALGDLNGDGKPDMVVANYCQSNSCSGDGEVSVLLGNGDGTFQTAIMYDSGGYDASSVALGDVNGDGKPDMVVANYCQSNNCSGDGEVSVLLGNGDGTFQTAAPYDSGGYHASSVALGDVNGDGKLDIVVANNYSNDVSVLLGNGNGTFQAAVSYLSGGYYPNAVAIADVNGDGYQDLIVASLCGSLGQQGNCDGTGTMGVLIGNGDGTFQPVITDSSGAYYTYSVAVADVNGDGKPDLVAGNSCTGLRGRGDCNSGISASILLNKTSLVTTTTKVTSSPDPSLVNQSVTFTATITSNDFVPNGSVVTFYNGKTKIGTNTTTNGVATLTTSFGKPGKYSVKSTYPGGGFLRGSSGTVKQIVNP